MMSAFELPNKHPDLVGSTSQLSNEIATVQRDMDGAKRSLTNTDQSDVLQEDKCICTTTPKGHRPLDSTTSKSESLEVFHERAERPGRDVAKLGRLREPGFE